MTDHIIITPPPRFESVLISPRFAEPIEVDTSTLNGMRVINISTENPSFDLTRQEALELATTLLSFLGRIGFPDTETGALRAPFPPISSRLIDSADPMAGVA